MKHSSLPIKKVRSDDNSRPKLDILETLEFFKTVFARLYIIIIKNKLWSFLAVEDIFYILGLL
jgi:hypothetical protein